jgi:hypothetical protein
MIANLYTITNIQLSNKTIFNEITLYKTLSIEILNILKGIPFNDFMFIYLNILLER